MLIGCWELGIVCRRCKLFFAINTFVNYNVYVSILMVYFIVDECSFVYQFFKKRCFGNMLQFVGILVSIRIFTIFYIFHLKS